MVGDDATGRTAKARRKVERMEVNITDMFVEYSALNIGGGVEYKKSVLDASLGVFYIYVPTVFEYLMLFFFKKAPSKHHQVVDAHPERLAAEAWKQRAQNNFVKHIVLKMTIKMASGHSVVTLHNVTTFHHDLRVDVAWNHFSWCDLSDQRKRWHSPCRRKRPDIYHYHLQRGS
jgi:hypothetical protein